MDGQEDDLAKGHTEATFLFRGAEWLVPELDRCARRRLEVLDACIQMCGLWQEEDLEKFIQAFLLSL